jgi:hypothetical protein
MIHAGVAGDERKKAFVVGQRHALPDLICSFVMTLWLNSTRPARAKRARFPIPTHSGPEQKPTVLTITFSFIRLR